MKKQPSQNLSSKKSIAISVIATSGSTATKESSDLEVEQDFAKNWVVIVWNDPVNLMTYVTFVFQKLFGYSKEKAETLMLDVHHKGKAVVSIGTKEKAELDVSRLHEYGLWATMQRD